jgi:hypothetical protein
MKEPWRMKAQFESECPRCMDWILPGQWIVEDAEIGGWSHCVCPSDAQRPQPKAPTSYTEFVQDADGNMVELERTLGGE